MKSTRNTPRLKNEELLTQIARRIKTLREARGLTQEQVFYDTGVHIGRIETGKLNITISTLDSLCRYLGVSLQEFFLDG